MSGGKPILYTCSTSSCAFRYIVGGDASWFKVQMEISRFASPPKISLALKRIEYEQRQVSLLSNDQFGEYMEINPMAQVPALAVEGRTLCQSVAILEFLEEKYPQVPLLPADPYDRAAVREIVEMVNSGMQPLTNDSPVDRHSSDLEEQLVWKQHWIEKGFMALEKRLAKTSGKYCFGDNITLADLFVVPQTVNAFKWNVDMTKYPTISRLFDTLMSLDAFKESHPSSQLK